MKGINGPMRATVVSLAAFLGASPAWAQPIIIPLENQPAKPPAPEVSAPPVAPPQAGPSIPNNVAEGDGDQSRPEVATQPAPVAPQQEK